MAPVSAITVSRASLRAMSGGKAAHGPRHIEAAGATRAAGGSGVAIELARALDATRALVPQWTADRAFTWPWPLNELYATPPLQACRTAGSSTDGKKS